MIVTVHGSGLRLIELGTKHRARRYARALKKVDHVIAAGPAIAPVIKEILDYDADEVMCAGVDDLHFFREDDIPKEYDFIFVGALQESKGVDVRLDALEQVNDLGIKVCCVGAGPLEQRVKGLGQSVYIDVFRDVPQRRLRRLFNQSRYLVFPSRGYGFGLVVSEAMYCGTPPVVFAESGAQSQVRHNENGLIYKPNTADKLARVLADAFRLDGDAYEALSIGAHNANRDLSLDAVCKAHLALYRRLASGNPITTASSTPPSG